ncbi:MAG: acyl--CoA ligase [Burkholderiaceae bacterium]|nr:acyl--CoA ligase [Burkholderiaceae bacterium]MCD8564539.1 acyl--CoA ligase [Burkholderiaceae bacterium]
MMLTLHDPEQARRYYLDGSWQQDTLFTLLQHHASEHPNTVALRDPFSRLVWSEVLVKVQQVAASLHSAGLKTGDRVAVWLPNRIESIIILLACSRNGYVCCPSLHQSYRVGEIVDLLNRTRCKALFTTPNFGADGTSASVYEQLDRIPTLQRIYTVYPHRTEQRVLPEGSVPFPDNSTDLTVMPPPDLNPDKVVYLAFTSGTTGLPKGVMHSDNTLLANGRSLVATWKHDRKTVLLSMSPISHHIATVAIEQWLIAGLELVVPSPDSSIKPLDWIIETGATYVMGVPTHAMDILDDLKRRNLRKLGQVNCFYMAGAPIPREVAESFIKLGIKPQNVYGMTENGSHQSTSPDDDISTIITTCGKPCKGYEVRLFNPDDPDQEVPTGQIGEIGSRGALLTLGYYDDQKSTEDSFNRHGWFLSGDLGILDDQGNLSIVGRKKDLIIRGGHNIHPAHIEDLAHRHPEIAKAAAFGVHDDRLGEKVCLAIICRGESPLEPAEVLNHLHAVGLSKYDMPEFFIQLPSFPLTASGKILKRELKEMVIRNDIKPVPVRFVLPETEPHKEQA